MGFESNVYLWFNIVLICLHVSIAREISLYRYAFLIAFHSLIFFLFSGWGALHVGKELKWTAWPWKK